MHGHVCICIQSSVILYIIGSSHIQTSFFLDGCAIHIYKHITYAVTCIFMASLFLYAVVDVDVGSTGFAPGKKNYERVKQCLLSSNLCCDFLVSWTPQGKIFIAILYII